MANKILESYLDRSDPKVRRRIAILGESVASQLYVYEIGASNEVEELIQIIDSLVQQFAVLDKVTGSKSRSKTAK